MLCGPLDKTLVSVLVHDPPIGSILREDTAYHQRNTKSLLMVADVALLKTIQGKNLMGYYIHYISLLRSGSSDSKLERSDRSRFWRHKPAKSSNAPEPRLPSKSQSR